MYFFFRECEFLLFELHNRSSISPKIGLIFSMNKFIEIIYNVLSVPIDELFYNTYIQCTMYMKYLNLSFMIIFLINNHLNILKNYNGICRIT